MQSRVVGHGDAPWTGGTLSTHGSEALTRSDGGALKTDEHWCSLGGHALYQIAQLDERCTSHTARTIEP